MPIITAKVSDELLAYIDLVSGGNRQIICGAALKLAQVIGSPG
ncbi:hypothetical protein KKU99_p00510 (plasmid) [Citrobacter portucalensis]|uniref:Uncharacterized protein n=1 Tax=Citrobacter portucalensis TaxID=1639133 RepID=A0A9Q9P4T0_9ENTR|nr:hypothetical protein KKU99_p00510 [Citrobacter portucalensis]